MTNGITRVLLQFSDKDYQRIVKAKLKTGLTWEAYVKYLVTLESQCL